MITANGFGYGYTKIFASMGGTTLSEYTEFTNISPTWTKSYTYLGDSQLSTITPNGTGGEIVEYNHPDLLGTRATTNQAAGTSTEQAHLPFGTALNGETSRSESKRFTSYERSVRTGLDYAVNRIYDSKQGRFTQVDPIGMDAANLGYPQTLNLYAYCGNDPINNTDPSGLFWGFFKKLFKWVVTAITVVIAILTIIAAPPTLLGILGAISAGAGAASSVLGALGYRKAAAIFGLIALVTGFGSVISAKMGKGNFAGEGGKVDLTGAWLGIFAGVGAIVNNFQQKSQKQRKIKRNLCVSLQTLVDRYLSTLIDLLSKQSGHRTDAPLENGGWIYQRRDGSTFFKTVDLSRRSEGGINLKNPPKIKGARVIALAHTHPYNAKDQDNINAEGFGNSGISGADAKTANAPFDLSKATGIPNLVTYEDNPKGINDSKMKPGQIYVRVTSVGPNITCGDSR